jgi:hypothetical protein
MNSNRRIRRGGLNPKKSFKRTSFIKNPEKGGSPARFKKFNENSAFTATVVTSREESFWLLVSSINNITANKNTP